MALQGEGDRTNEESSYNSYNFLSSFFSLVTTPTLQMRLASTSDRTVHVLSGEHPLAVRYWIHSGRVYSSSLHDPHERRIFSAVNGGSPITFRMKVRSTSSSRVRACASVPTLLCRRNKDHECS